MAILAGLCITAFIMVSNRQRQLAYEAYDLEDYARAAAIFDAWPWVRDPEEPKYEYSLARVREDEGKGGEAAVLYDGLGDYADSARRAVALWYAEGKRLMEEGALVEALEVFEGLPGHEDSDELAGQLAAYLEAGRYAGAVERYRAFDGMGGFLDSAAQAKQAAAEVYAEAWNAYAAGEFEQAGELYAAIAGYADADSYTRLVGLWRQVQQAVAGGQPADGYETARQLLPQVQRLAAAVDAGPVLVSSEFLHVFLEGRWETGDAEKFFYMDIGRSEFEFDKSLGVTGPYDFYGTQMVSSASGPTVTFGYLAYDRIQIAVEGAGVEEYARVA